MAIDRDEQFAELLADFDAQLANGDTGADSSTSAIVEPELASRLEDAKDCLRLIEQFWPRSPTGDDVALPGPRQLDRFQIVRELGRGGFGIVYLAEDPRLERLVALKVQRPEALLSAELRSRFLREAQATARLRHPYIAGVYDAGESGLQVWIATEYCPGISLAGWLAEHRGTTSAREAAQLVAHLAEALDYSHRQGVLHRDLKPGNILLERSLSDDTFDSLNGYTPKIIDFGLAKLLEGQHDETRTGARLGSLWYMAPEQAEGRAREIAAPSDVWALGAILYELLTGRPPHQGESDSESLRRLLLDEPIPPRRLAPRVPADLEAIVLKCLEKAPRARYATAGDLAADLNRFLAGQPTQVRPLGPLRRLAKWARRRPAVAALSAVVIASVLTILIGSMTYNGRLRHSLEEVSKQRTVAELAVRDLKRMLYAADIQRAHEAWNNNHIAQVQDFLAAQDPKPGEEDLREFAWYYLHGLCNQQLATLNGHVGDVFTVAASPDGTVWATAGKDKTVRLWDAKTYTPLAVFKDHAGEVIDVDFSPNSEFLASASEDGTVRIWNVKTGGSPRTISAHVSTPSPLNNQTSCVAYSPDGKLLASGGRDNFVRIWNSDTLEQVAELKGREVAVMAVTFSRNGETLIAADDNGAAFSWNVADWKLADQRTFEKETFFALVPSPLEDLIACAGQRKTVRLWNVANQKLDPDGELQGGHREWILGLAFSPHENKLASSDKAGILQLWDLATQQRRVILGHTDRVWSLDWSPDGKTLASADANGQVRIWDGDLRADASVAYPSVDFPLDRVVYTPECDRLVAVGRNGKAARFDARRHELLETYTHPSDHWDTLQVSPAGEFIAGLSNDDQLTVGRFGDTSPPLVAVPVPLKYNSRIGLSVDGKRVAYEADGTTVWIANLESGQRQTVECGALIDFLRFSPDNIHLAIAAQNKLLIWNCVANCTALELPRTRGVFYSADGQLLVTRLNTALCIYDARTGQQLQEFVNRQDKVADVAISPDHNTVAIVDETGDIVNLHRRITLLDVRSGYELLTLQVEARELAFVGFSPEGNRLLVCGTDEHGMGLIREWTIKR